MLRSFIAALLLLTAPAYAREPSANLPIPEKYYGEAKATTFYLHPYDVNVVCQQGRPDPNWIVYACADRQIMILPDPCLYPEAKDTASYAYLVCHEKAHVKGWEHP